MSENHHTKNSHGKNSCYKNSHSKKECKEECKDECKDECKNLEHPKVIKRYINSNVQYTADWYDSITIGSWGIISLIEKGKNKCESKCKNVYWVANNGSKTLGKYFHNGELLEEVKTTGPPTGLVYNYTDLYRQYQIITVTTFGTIEGLRIDDNNNPDASTEVIIETFNAIYTGVDLNRKRLYAVNFASGQVEMYDVDFNLIGSFTDDALVNSGYYPYNVAIKGKYVYVTFARKLNENCAIPGIGFGYVDIFSRDSQLLFRHIARDPLNAPWGLTFSECSKYLYVGNNGDGKINIFDLCSGEFIGPVMDKNCNPIQIGGLFGISLNSDRLSFAAGIDASTGDCNIGENGLIGYLQIC